MRRVLILLAVLPMILAGCLTGEQPGASPGGDASPIEEPVRVVEEGGQSGIHEPTEEVITNQADWEAFWTRHTADHLDGPPAPEVGFPEERVVAVVLGQRPNGCYAARVTDATTFPSEGVTRVSVTEYTPPPDAFCTEALTYPFSFVAIPARDTEVAFETKTVEGPPDEPRP